jgi:hypothetical protein
MAARKKLEGMPTDVAVDVPDVQPQPELVD